MPNWIALDANDFVEPFSSPEDALQKKLGFFCDGGSNKHLRDIANMITTQGAESLDWEYLENWVKQLDVKQQLDQVRK